jgi:hypothetical protein
MNRLRRISLLLGIILATVVARMIIDGLSLLSALTAALILALLVGSLRLKQLGRGVRPGSGPKPIQAVRLVPGSAEFRQSRACFGIEQRSRATPPDTSIRDLSDRPRQDLESSFVLRAGQAQAEVGDVLLASVSVHEVPPCVERTEVPALSVVVLLSECAPRTEGGVQRVYAHAPCLPYEQRRGRRVLVISGGGPRVARGSAAGQAVPRSLC